MDPFFPILPLSLFLAPLFAWTLTLGYIWKIRQNLVRFRDEIQLRKIASQTQCGDQFLSRWLPVILGFHPIES